jgi:hypothetical protein
MQTYNLQTINVLTAQGFNQSGGVVPVQFPVNSSTYFLYSLGLSDTAIRNISRWNQTRPAYKLKCVYYDESKNKWAGGGVEFLSFDNLTGIANCKSYHLTQFSVIFASNPLPTPEPAPIVPPSPPQQPNSTP